MLNLILKNVKARTLLTPNLVVYEEVENLVVCEEVEIRLGPYDNSDALVIKYLPDTNEVIVLHEIGSDVAGNTEAIGSFLLETP